MAKDKDRKQWQRDTSRWVVMHGHELTDLIPLIHEAWDEKPIPPDRCFGHHYEEDHCRKLFAGRRWDDVEVHGLYYLSPLDWMDPPADAYYVATLLAIACTPGHPYCGGMREAVAHWAESRFAEGQLSPLTSTQEYVLLKVLERFPDAPGAAVAIELLRARLPRNAP